MFKNIKKLLNPKQTLKSIIKREFNSIYDLSQNNSTLIQNQRKLLTLSDLKEEDKQVFKSTLFSSLNTNSIQRQLISKQNRQHCKAETFTAFNQAYLMTNKELLHINKRGQYTVELPQLYYFYSKLNFPSTLFSSSLLMEQEGNYGASLIAGFENCTFIQCLYANILTKFYYNITDAAALYRSCADFKLNGINSYYLISSEEFKSEIEDLLLELKSLSLTNTIVPIYIPAKDLLLYGLYAILLEGSTLTIFSSQPELYMSKASYKEDKFLEVLVPFSYAISGINRVSFCYSTARQLYNFPEIRSITNV